MDFKDLRNFAFGLLSDPSALLHTESHPTRPGGAMLALRQDGSGYKLLELDGPPRNMRGHLFADLPGFAAWLNRHAGPEQTEILGGVADDGQLYMDAALDAREAQSDVVSARVPLHPIFLQWFRLIGRPMSQKALHEHLRACSSHITSLVGCEVSGSSGPGEFLLGQVSSLSLATGANVKAQLDSHGLYRVLAREEKQDISATLPTGIRIEVPWFEGVLDGETDRVYTLELLLSLDVTDSGLVFRLSCPGLPIVQKHAVDEAMAYLGDLLDDGFLVGRGKLSLKQVNG